MQSIMLSLFLKTLSHKITSPMSNHQICISTFLVISSQFSKTCKSALQHHLYFGTRALHGMFLLKFSVNTDLVDHRVLSTVSLRAKQVNLGDR